MPIDFRRFEAIRARYASRYALRMLNATHVVVGDHDPELRASRGLQDDVAHFSRRPPRTRYHVSTGGQSIEERRTALEWEADTLRQGR